MQMDHLEVSLRQKDLHSKPAVPRESTVSRSSQQGGETGPRTTFGEKALGMVFNSLLGQSFDFCEAIGLWGPFL